MKNKTETFIEKAKKVHGDRYDYSMVEYKGSHHKVTIVCKEHGQFLQAPTSHLGNHGCPKCYGNKKSTTEEFIKKAKSVHGNRYNYSKVEYKNWCSKVVITCPKHGDFLQRATDHLKKCGCPSCSGKARLTTEEFIKRSKNTHNNKYDYSKVKYVNLLTKVTIICPEHGKFEQSASNHLVGYGCSKCANNTRKTTEEFIKRAKEVHGNKYDYSKTNYTNCKTKVEIICLTHGSFFQSTFAHLKGVECPECRKIPETEWLKRFKKAYGKKYNYSEAIFKEANDEIKIICKICNQYFSQSPSLHYFKRIGCPNKCYDIKIDEEEWLKRFDKVHDNKYDYSKSIFRNAHDKIEILCKKCNRYFWQEPNHHYGNQSGCPRCLFSKGEAEVERILELINVQFIAQKTFEKCKNIQKLRFDFYIPSENTVIEYDGRQHYLPVPFPGMSMKKAETNFKQIVKNDKIKNNFCNTNGIKIIRIPYTEFKNIEEIIKKELNIKLTL